MNPFALLGSVFDTFFFKPIVTVLVLVLNYLQDLGVGGALGWAIVALTLVVRFIVWPFITTQIRSAKKMADLRPLIDELKLVHKDNRQELLKAQTALYKEHGVSPAGGCLPALIQFPVFIALANAIPLLFYPEGLARINELVFIKGVQLTSQPDAHFLGFNLADKVSDKAIFSPEWGSLMLVPLITMGLSFIQSKMMFPTAVKKYNSDSPKEKKEKEGTEDMMASMQSQMMYMMPLMIGVFSYNFPVGVALYWNIFTLVGIVQQYLVSGWGGMESWVKLIRR